MLEFLTAVAVDKSVGQYLSDDQSVLVLVFNEGEDGFTCEVYAGYEWQRVDGTRQEWLYEWRGEATTRGHGSWEEAVKRALSLTKEPDGI